MPEYVVPDFVRLRTGLLDPKHVKAMGGGSPLVLYFWLHARVRFKGDEAGEWFPDEPYTHELAAKSLQEPVSSVRRWFYALVRCGYIVARRGRYGLHITITKYGKDATKDASRVSANEHSGVSTSEQSQPSRVPTDEQADAVQTAHQWRPDCSPVAGRVSKNEHSPINKESSRDTRETGEGAPARTPLQLVVDAYYAGLGRDPTKVGKEYARHTPAGKELADSGQTPQDVRNCTRWLASDPWRRSNGRMPSLAEVAAALPGWIDDRRPGSYRPPKDTKPARGMTSVLDYYARRGQRQALADGDTHEQPALPRVG